MADRLFAQNEARFNITWAGNNGDLVEAVPFDLGADDLRRLAQEAVQNGIPGIPADQNANFADFVVDRFPSNDEVPDNRIFLRPKTPFGCDLAFG